jgi:uncharacterized delta-60 repeat protein
MRRTKISLIFIFVLAVALPCALWETRASADSPRPIAYHNGPVMAGSSNDSLTFKPRDGILDSNGPTASIMANPNSSLDGFDPSANGLVRSIVVQPNGRILIGGDFTTLAPNGGISVVRNYIARLNTDGTVDPSFNPNADSSVQAIALQSDGKVIIGGDFNALAPNGGASINRNFIARLNADGTVDTTFDPRANGAVLAVTVQPDGSIIIGGDFTVLTPGGGASVTRKRIARLNSDGTVDPNFDPSANTTVNALTMQIDGRVLVGGRFTTLTPDGGPTVMRNYFARLNVDGTVDASFNPNPNNILGAIAVQADGRILIGGEFASLTPNGGASVARNHMARLNPDGTIDSTFDPSPNGFVRTISLQTDGRVLIGGGFNSLTPNGGALVVNKYLARLNTDGTLDPSVNPAPNDQIFAIAVQPDNKIVVGGPFYSANSFKGQTRNRIARLEIDGRLDQTLNLNALGSSVSASAVQSDGKILIGGNFNSVLGVARKNIARLNTDGTLDMTFNPNANDYIDAFAVQPDGKIIVGGFFTALAPNGGASVTRNHIARLNSDGTLDTTFDPNANDLVAALAIQTDGKILLSGLFTALAPNGGGLVGRNTLARLNSDGTVDMAFNAVPNLDVYAIALQADGKILIGGAFTLINGGGQFARNFIARLNSDGTVDAGFNPNASNRVYVIAVQPDGKIVVGGGFGGFAPNGGASVARSCIARLNSDGTVDNAFDPSADNFVVTLALQADQKILVGGAFSTLTPNGGPSVTRNCVARLNLDGTVDTTFDPNAPDGVSTVGIQADGKILIGGSFANVGGQSRNLFARLANDTAAVQKLTVTPPTIFWERSGAAPQLSRVTFERSSDGINYTFLGNGTRIGASNTFALFSQNLPVQQNLYVRARGYYRGSYLAGSESITESVRNAFMLPAMHLAFSQQPVNTVKGSTIAPPVTVQIVDTSDNPVNTTFAVTIALGNNPSGATLSGTKTVSAVNGLATFNDLSIDKAGSYTLMATGPIFGTTSSNQFTITSPASSAIAATAGSGQSATINSSFAAALQATVKDATGNPVSGVNVTFTAPASGASGKFTNNATTTTATTNASGVASASTFTANGEAGAYTVAASINSGSFSTSFSLNNLKANQAISVITHAPVGAAYNTQFNVAATSSSGLPVSYSSSGACTNNGAAFTITAGGNCTVKYDQPGDANHNAASQVTETVTVQKAAQAITFDALPAKTFGDNDFIVNASASSGLPVSFAALGQCTTSGSSIHINGAGDCTIKASQGGDSNYEPATEVARSFHIAKASTTTGLSSSGSSSQSLTFSASVTSPAGVPNGTVTFKKDGTVIVSCRDLPLSSGRATCITSADSASTYTVIAEYSGAANFNASTGTLMGEQATGMFEFSQTTYMVAEGGSVTIAVKRTGDVTKATSIKYATDNGSGASAFVPCSQVTGIALDHCDYTRAAGRLRFDANETEKSFVVLVNDDSYVEGTETVSLKLSNPSNGATLGLRATATLQIMDDLVESSGNPIDNEPTFVRQHYHDFLNREPDSNGLSFWTNEITSCGPDAACMEVKRNNVSAAFYISIEFQETGYLVERFYKAAYGDFNGSSTLGGAHQLPVPIVRFSEFLPDTQQIGNGVIVKQGNWQQQLEDNKQAFAREFISRQRFTNAYPTTLSASEFVRQLNVNAGDVLTEAEIIQLENAFGGPNAPSTDVVKRAEVLRSVADNQTLQQREFNRAFVLMQYFGYLRRNPDEAPDTDYTGFDFWLRKLEQHGGNYVNAEMVKAFILSGEYRQRFGQ